MFKKYDRETFDVLREQHNIMALVGNGFDVAMLNKYNTGSLPGKTSTYNDLLKIIYVFLTIFLYLLKCPQSLIL